MVAEVDYLYGLDSRLAAARLRCRVSRGTFPRVSWLLNASVLSSETHADPGVQPLPPHHALAEAGRTLFLSSLGPEDSGLYRCRARDSYDDSGPWVESDAVLVRATGDDTNCGTKVISLIILILSVFPCAFFFSFLQTLFNTACSWSDKALNSSPAATSPTETPSKQHVLHIQALYTPPLR